MNFPPGMPPYGRGGPPAGPPGPPADPYQAAILAELRAMRAEQAHYSRLIGQTLSRSDGGDNPFGYPPRPATVTEFGVGHSGPQRTFTVEGGVSTKSSLLNCIIKEIVPQGYYGMATVHVATRLGDLAPVVGGAIPNVMLLGTLEWQSGTAGGTEQIDLTRGAVIPVGGTTSIQLAAEFVSVDGTTPLVAFADVIAEATVCWETSATKDPPMSLPAVTLTAPGGLTSAWIEIPRQSASMLALGTPATAYPTLIAEFSISDTVGGALVRYQVPNPFVNGAPIRGGVNFTRFVNTVGMVVFPTFELH